MVKDYKITTTVNKELYMRLRGKLMMGGLTFSDWLTSQMDNYDQKFSSESAEVMKVIRQHVTRPQVPTVTTGPISKGGPVITEKRGEISLDEEFHPVPKK